MKIIKLTKEEFNIKIFIDELGNECFIIKDMKFIKDQEIKKQ